MPRYTNFYTDSQIGLRIKKTRKLLNLTQRQLAAKLNISYQQLQKYENGKCKLSVVRLLQLCKVLYVKPHHFLKGLD